MPKKKSLLPLPKDIEDKILDIDDYISLVDVWLTFKHPSDEIRSRLAATAHGTAHYFDQEHLPYRFRKDDIFRLHRKRPEYIAKITIHYPTEDTFLLLKEIEENYTYHEVWTDDYKKLLPNLRLSRVDIAKDLVCNTDTEAVDVMLYIDAHLVKKYPGKQTIHLEKGTTRYTGSTATASKIVAYEKPSSPRRDEPCAHIEWRATRHQSVNAIKIQSISDQINYDCRGMWKDRFVLKNIDDKTKIRIGKIVLDETHTTRQLKRKQYKFKNRVFPVFNAYLKAGNQFIRTAQNSLHQGDVSGKGKYVYTDVQSVLDRLKQLYGARVGKNIKNYFPNVDTSFFL